MCSNIESKKLFSKLIEYAVPPSTCEINIFFFFSFLSIDNTINILLDVNVGLGGSILDSGEHIQTT